MTLWVSYEDQADSGIWYDEVEGKTVAFKEYRLKLTLVSKKRKVVRAKKYNSVVEETQMNIPFTHERLEPFLREDMDDFFRIIKFEAISTAPHEEERDEDEVVKEILEEVLTKDINFDEEEETEEKKKIKGDSAL